MSKTLLLITAADDGEEKYLGILFFEELTTFNKKL